MATDITANVRSPRYYFISGTGSKTLNLKIWDGDVVSVPSTNTYTLTKDAINGQAVFEISDLIRDYIDQTFTGTYTCAAVWVKINSDTPFIAFDGYGYYTEGNNPNLSNRGLISNTTIWIPDGEKVRMPVYTSASTNTVSSVKYYAFGVYIDADTITPSGFSNAQIAYPNYTINNNIKATEVRVYYNADASYDSYSVKYMDCSRYDTYKITFVNKFGALQDLYFMGKSVESLKISKDGYKSNILNNAITYDPSTHQYKDFDLQGRQSINLTTGYVSEDINEPIKQLMLSEKVWMTQGSVVTPVNVKTSSLVVQTSVNDKMISYTLDFDFAHDIIQNVR